MVMLIFITHLIYTINHHQCDRFTTMSNIVVDCLFVCLFKFYDI